MPPLPGPRVLSLRQPWAWAVAAGHKRVENRSWSTRYRGIVYIHASTKIDRAGLNWLKRKKGLVPRADDMPVGVIVAVANLTDVVTRKRAPKFGKWFFGPYGFVLADIRRLRRPVPTLGRLGLFRPSPALIRQVRRARPSKPR
jgi:hypothetical protein